MAHNMVAVTHSNCPNNQNDINIWYFKAYGLWGKLLFEFDNRLRPYETRLISLIYVLKFIR